MSTTIPYAAIPARRPTLRERINPRILIFVGVFALLIGFPIYTAIDSAMSGGLKNRGDFYEVDLKAMSTFPFDQTNGQLKDVPQQWRNLDGKTVEMVGEVAPGGWQARGVDQGFDLVYSVQKCCYSGEPQIQHFIKVTVPRSADVKFTHEGSLQVRGKLRVEVTRDAETGRINGIYHVVADKVESI